jgi:hypothetical protein
VPTPALKAILSEVADGLDAVVTAPLSVAQILRGDQHSLHLATGKTSFVIVRVAEVEAERGRGSGNAFEEQLVLRIDCLVPDAPEGTNAATQENLRLDLADAVLDWIGSNRELLTTLYPVRCEGVDLNIGRYLEESTQVFRVALFAVRGKRRKNC